MSKAIAQPNNGIRHPKKRAFLAGYATTGSVTAAAELAGIDRTTHYMWLTRDRSGNYAAAFAHALEEACDSLEAEARRRGLKGVERGVWHNGEKVGTERVFSDVLLIFLLKGNNPAKFRDRFDVRNTNVNPDMKDLQASMQDMMQDPECAELAERLANRLSKKAVEVKVLDSRPLSKRNGRNGNGQAKTT